MLKYLYNPGSANLPSAEPWASVMICCAKKRGVGTWDRTPGHGDPQCTDVDLPFAGS